MAMQYYPEIFDEEYVVCDIDGTIANLEHRLHFINNDDGTVKEVKDWKGFFANVEGDKPIESTIEILSDHIAKGRKIIFVSARPESCRYQTEWWLWQHLEDKLGMEYVHLIMRGSDDRREDTDVKRDIHRKFLASLNVKCIIDDRPQVIRMWREEGYEVTDVGDGVDF